MGGVVGTDNVEYEDKEDNPVEIVPDPNDQSHSLSQWLLSNLYNDQLYDEQEFPSANTSNKLLFSARGANHPQAKLEPKISHIKKVKSMQGFYTHSNKAQGMGCQTSERTRAEQGELLWAAQHGRNRKTTHPHE